MREVNLRAIDLNLLVALQSLLGERHITRAAEQVGMSQPAMSRALGRLRDLFHDPLLVHTSEGYDLTPRARQLVPALHRILGEISRMVEPPSFDPTNIEATVKLSAMDNEMILVLPRVLCRLQREAPGLKLNVSNQPSNHLALLDNGEVDFCLSGIQEVPHAEDYHRYELLRDEYAVLMSAGHELAKGELTLERYANAKHGLINLTGEGPGIVDLALVRFGLTRDVIVRLPHVLAATELCAGLCSEGRLIFTLPRIIAQRVAPRMGLVWREPPAELQLQPFPIYLYWHERHHHDPMHQWLRQLIRDETAQLNQECLQEAS